MLYFLCFLPPFAILFSGFKPFTLIVNILLTLFFIVPGVIHAFFVVNAHKADQRTKKVRKEIRAQTKEMKKARELATDLAEQKQEEIKSSKS